MYLWLPHATQDAPQRFLVSPCDGCSPAYIHLPLLGQTREDASQGSASSQDGAHRRLCPEAGLRWEGGSVPIAELGACRARAGAPRGQLAADRRALHLDPPVEYLWVKRFTGPKSSDIFCGGG